MKEAFAQAPHALNGTDLTIRDFIAPLFRRKRLAVFTFLGIVVAALTFVILSGPIYGSRMAILVNRERLDPLVSTEATTQIMTSENPVTPEEINSEVELLSSRDVLEQVVVANGLAESRGFSLIDLFRPNQTKQDRIARAVKTLARKIKISNIKNSNLIEATYKSDDAQRSYGVLKSLGDLYLAKHVAVHRPAGSYEFFAEETKKYHDELNNAEQKLRNFGRDNAIAAPDQQRTNLATKAADSIGLMHDAEQAIAADEERIRVDRQQLSQTPSRSTTLQASATNDKVISDLNASLTTAQAKRTQLLMKYDPQYPLVREVEQEIAEDKSAIAQAESKRYVSETTDRDPTYELIREDLAKTETDLAAHRATLATTKQSIKSIQAEMVKLDQLSISQQDLQREAKADESNYLLYLAKREQERTSNALDVTRIANVAIAVPPAIPVLPVLGFPAMVLISIAAAIVLSIGAAYAADYFDPSFHSPAQVSEILGIPVVVSISKKTA